MKKMKGLRWKEHQLVTSSKKRTRKIKYMQKKVEDMIANNRASQIKGRTSENKPNFSILFKHDNVKFFYISQKLRKNRIL